MSRSIKLSLALAVSVAVLIPVAAVASHQFTDVPDSNIFHDDIAWMADNNVTKGCNPPANDKYCPSNTVTREQMAAFMHRLAVNKVVDAKTATNADNAADADKLDGLDSTAFRSIAASASWDITVAGGPTVLAPITGLDAPAAGGAILASATLTAAENSGPQLAILWIEIDGSGSCDGLADDGSVIWETSTASFDNGTALASAAVSAGSHRVDVCHGGLGADTTNVTGKVLVEWVPIVSGAGLTEAGVGASLEELLAPHAHLLDN